MSYFRSFFKTDLWQAVGATFIALFFARQTFNHRFRNPVDRVPGTDD